MSSLRQWFRNKCHVIVELSPIHLVSVDTEIDRGLLRIAVINSTKTNRITTACIDCRRCWSLCRLFETTVLNTIISRPI
jgi:hypothetical protein